MESLMGFPRFEGVVIDVDDVRVLVEVEPDLQLPSILFPMSLYRGKRYKGEVAVLRRVGNLLVCVVTNPAEGQSIEVNDLATPFL